MRLTRHLLPAILLLASLAAAKSPTAALFPFSARGVDSNSTRILEDALADGLMKSGKLRLLERSQMTTVLKEQGFQKSGACDGEQCAVQMGKLLGIEQGVVGSVGLLGKTWVMNARIINVGTGEVVKSTQRSLSGEIDKALTDLIPAVVSDLTDAPKAPVTAKSDASKEDSKSSGAWVWWTLGGVAVAGGTAAALLLTGKKSSTPAASTGTNNGGTDQSGSLTFKWN